MKTYVETTDIDEWQIAGIKSAIAAADRGELVSHACVKKWVELWGTANEQPMPKPERK